MDRGPALSTKDEDLRPNDSLYEALRQDDRNPERNAVLLERSPPLPDVSPIDKACFIDRSYHDAEVSKLWSRVWQMACLEQDIPNIGDFQEYNIVNQSILVVRNAQNEVRAFYNVCQHRGTKLKSGMGRAREIRCSFHGWAWDLDGQLTAVPCAWDFPTVSNETHKLKEVRAEVWNGFVFINLDPAALPLREFLGETILRHFDNWPLGKRFKSLHVAKIFPCNWKLAMAAFAEVYHVQQTHSSWQGFMADELTQYDHYGLHSRWIMPTAVANPGMADLTTPQEIVDAMNKDMFSAMFGKEEFPPILVEEGQTARARMADYRRESLKETAGDKFDGLSDSELLDGTEYWIFPNFFIFPVGPAPVLYRARPNGNDHESSIFEMMSIVPVGDQTVGRTPVPIREVGETESFYDVPELATTAKTLSEDAANLSKIQMGMHSNGFSGPIFARYQESALRQFHLNLEKWLTTE